MFRKSLFKAAAVSAVGLMALGAGTAFASPAASSPATPSQLGSFVYDRSGNEIGSWQGVDGRRAVIWIGVFNTPGNYLTTVPMRALSVEAGRLVLNEASSSLTTAR